MPNRTGTAGVLGDIAPHILATVGFVFSVAAISTTAWAEADVSTGTAFGTADIGLWKACSYMTPTDTPIFSVLAECRQGHCIRSSDLTPGSNWPANNLCDRATVAQAFSLLAMFSAIAVVLMTSWRALANRTVLWWKGSLFSLLAAVFSMIAWATWYHWMGLMNGDRPDAATISFSELSSGPGAILMVVTSLVYVLNCLLCRSRGIQQSRTRDQRKEQSATLEEHLRTERVLTNPAYDGHGNVQQGMQSI